MACFDTGHFNPHFIRGDQLSPMERYLARSSPSGMKPTLRLISYLPTGECTERLARMGVRVFLDGLRWRTRTVSHGFEYPPKSWAASAFHWKQLNQPRASLLAKNLFGGSRARKGGSGNYCVQGYGAHSGCIEAMGGLLHGRFREIPIQPARWCIRSSHARMAAATTSPQSLTKIPPSSQRPRIPSKKVSNNVRSKRTRNSKWPNKASCGFFQWRHAIRLRSAGLD